MSTHIFPELEAAGGSVMRARANDGAMKDSRINTSRRLPDIPWKYNPPAPEGFVRPKPVKVPKGK